LPGQSWRRAVGDGTAAAAAANVTDRRDIIATLMSVRGKEKGVATSKLIFEAVGGFAPSR
jgi:hypothetical protein